MSLFSFLLGEKKKTASVAKERLQIILAHERSSLNSKRPDYLPELQRELLAVISKYVSIRPEDLKVHVERQDDLEVLEVKIELPDAVKKAVTRPAVPSAPPAAAATPAGPAGKAR
jgi:cell division topological specificity factor